jgi:predicted ATP-grasp superfamily ATP-dependent carboligase
MNSPLGESHDQSIPLSSMNDDNDSKVIEQAGFPMSGSSKGDCCGNHRHQPMDASNKHSKIGKKYEKMASKSDKRIHNQEAPMEEKAKETVTRRKAMS